MSDRINVPEHLLSSRQGDHYVLRAVGDSMLEEGIRDGDFVIVLRTDQFQDGDMVVALVGDDATLKRIYRDGDAAMGRFVRLDASNPSMPPLRMRTEDVRVQGIAVGLMRKF